MFELIRTSYICVHSIWLCRRDETYFSISSLVFIKSNKRKLFIMELGDICKFCEEIHSFCFRDRMIINKRCWYFFCFSLFNGYGWWWMVTGKIPESDEMHILRYLEERYMQDEIYVRICKTHFVTVSLWIMKIICKNMVLFLDKCIWNTDCFESI